ncbi:MAG: cation:proton antiporter [Opitutales bacterium]
MSAPTAQQIILSVVLVFGIATACQVIAPKLRIPALVLLLPAGFLLGIVAPNDTPAAVLGPVFPVAVDFVVAIILFQGGVGLSKIKLQPKERDVVRRLVWIGAPITGALAAVAAHFIIGLPWPIAVMLGSILIVSGPTVINPILDFARPAGRVRGILVWEGTILDPVGALVAVVVFQIIKASNADTIPEGIGIFFFGVLVAVVAAAIGTALFVVGGKLTRGAPMLATQVVLGSVLVTAGLANLVTDDSGLLAALFMGITAPRVAKHFGATTDAGDAFFDPIVSIGIGVLFVSISALVPFDTVQQILVPTLAVAVLLIVIQRPLVTAVCSFGAGLSAKERLFIGLMDPRGIVAAATASSVGTVLVAAKVSGAQELLPAAFIIIAVTVTFYGLTATAFAKALGLREAEPASPTATVPRGDAP